MSVWQFAGLSASLALGGYIIGGIIAFAGVRWLHAHLHRLNILCGGLLIGLLVFEFLPHMFLYADPVAGGLGMIVGILTLIVVDHMAHDHPVQTVPDNDHFRRAVFLLCIGISLHNFPTGMAIGSAFSAQADFTPYMLVALFLHHIPEGLAISIPLLGKRPFLVQYLSLVGMLAVIVGLGTLTGIHLAGESFEIQTWLIGMAAGTISYVTVHEILWKTKPYVSRFDFIFYVTMGILLIKILL